MMRYMYIVIIDDKYISIRTIFVEYINIYYVYLYIIIHKQN